MPFIALSLLVTLLLTLSSWAQAQTPSQSSTPSLATFQDSLAYALGVQNAAHSVRDQQLTLSPTWSLGFETAYTGQRTLMSKKEAQNVLSEWHSRLWEKENRHNDSIFKANEKLQLTFLRENLERPEVMLLSNHLQYQILQERKSTQSCEDCEILFHCRITNLQGKIYLDTWSADTPIPTDHYALRGILHEISDILYVGRRLKVFCSSFARQSYVWETEEANKANELLIYEIERLKIPH